MDKLRRHLSNANDPEQRGIVDELWDSSTLSVCESSFHELTAQISNIFTTVISYVCLVVVGKSNQRLCGMLRSRLSLVRGWDMLVMDSRAWINNICHLLHCR